LVVRVEVAVEVGLLAEALAVGDGDEVLADLGGERGARGERVVLG